MTETDRIPADVSRVFELEDHGPDVWVGESPEYPWGRIYGGLVIAQALWAATQTVVPEHSVHSLHGYFILGGDPDEPVRVRRDHNQILFQVGDGPGARSRFRCRHRSSAGDWREPGGP